MPAANISPSFCSLCPSAGTQGPACCRRQEIGRHGFPKIEAADQIDGILKLPAKNRRSTADEIGRSLNVTNQERERLHLWTIRPVDMTDAELAEQRKSKDRVRKRRKRARVSRDTWLATNNLSKQEPWKEEGISRRTWYRRQKAGTGMSQENLPIPRTHLCHVAPDAATGTDEGREGTQERAPKGRAFTSPTSLPISIQTAMLLRLRADPQVNRTHLCHEANRAHL